MRESAVQTGRSRLLGSVGSGRKRQQTGSYKIDPLSTHNYGIGPNNIPSSTSSIIFDPSL